jgi:hypothetical protein
MSKSNTFENELLLHVFNNAAMADYGDGSGLPAAATAGSLYVALHTGDPGEAGNQSTSEANYTSYARVAVARAGGGWTVTGNAVENTAAITVPQATGGSSTATYFRVGNEVSGATDITYSGALAASLAITNGITPEFAAGDLDITED